MEYVDHTKLSGQSLASADYTSIPMPALPPPPQGFLPKAAEYVAGRKQAARAALTRAATKAAIARAATLKDLVHDACVLDGMMKGVYQGLYLARQYAETHPATCLAKATGAVLPAGAAWCSDFLWNSWRGGASGTKPIYELLCVATAEEAVDLQNQLGAQLELTLFDNLYSRASKAIARHGTRADDVEALCAFILRHAPDEFRKLVASAAESATAIAAAKHVCV